MRVLAIEDEQNVARALREGLDGEHYQVEVSATGEDGFFRAVSQPFDVIIQRWRSSTLAQVDPVLLREALVNIVDNAIKYSPPRAEIRMRVISRQQGGPAIEVLDAGPGIDAQHMPESSIGSTGWMRAARVSAAAAVSAWRSHDWRLMPTEDASRARPAKAVSHCVAEGEFFIVRQRSKKE